MSVVLRSSDVFATQKLASRSVHGCTLLDSLFQKAYGEYVLRYAATENAQHIKTDRDVRGSTQQRRGCLKSWLLFRHPREFKIKSLYSNDLILNIASKSKETVQKLKFLEVFLDFNFRYF